MTSSDTEPPSARQLVPPAARRIFYPASVIVLLFVILGAAMPSKLETWMTDAKNWMTESLGWYYILVVAGFIVFSIAVGLSRFGRVKLGPDDSKPEFSTVSWFAMLFSAGMGIGLLFYGVAEPLTHFEKPPYADPETQRAAQDALHTVFMHWGIHAWAIYIVVGLSLAYAVHRKGRSISLRWLLEPLLGDRVKGALGDLIDVVAIVSTLFGVATSLGLGASQVEAGLIFLGVTEQTDGGMATPIVIIVAITSLAIWSVLTGVKRGVKYLSNLNIGLAAALLLFVLFAGPTLFLLREFFSAVGYYFQNILRTSFDAGAFPTGAYDPGGFQADWTSFYWGWWISWAPFVGVFIARISRGRTVREFVAGVLLVPTVVSFVWFTVLGGTALHRQLYGEGGLKGLSNEERLFRMLEGLPLTELVAVLAVLLIVTFFVTSSDSGSLVVDMLASGGEAEPPKPTRVFWAVMEGAVAIVLLSAGGLAALQSAVILTALPFSIIMILVCVATWRALSQEQLPARVATAHGGAVESDPDPDPAPASGSESGPGDDDGTNEEDLEKAPG